MPNEKVLVLIDNQNLHLPSNDELPGRMLEYGRLKKMLLDDRDCLNIIAFVVDDGTNNAKVVFNILRGIGIDLRIKPLKIFGNGKRKGDCDVDITVEALRLLYTKAEFDTLVLVSGDGDFVPLVKEMQDFGKRVEVVSWSSNIAEELWRASDEYCNLSEFKDIISIPRNYSGTLQ